MQAGYLSIIQKKNLFLVTYENYSIQSNEKIHGFLILLKSTTTTLHNWSHNKKPRLIIGVFDFLESQKLKVKIKKLTIEIVAFFIFEFEIFNFEFKNHICSFLALNPLLSFLNLKFKFVNSWLQFSLQSCWASPTVKNGGLKNNILLIISYQFSNK